MCVCLLCGGPVHPGWLLVDLRERSLAGGGGGSRPGFGEAQRGRQGEQDGVGRVAAQRPAL